MRNKHEKIYLAALLIFISIASYSFHFLLFRDTHHIFIYLIGDIAFLPLQILFVSLIFDKIIEDREKKSNLKKLNMVIGAFFSETGVHFLKMLRLKDQNVEELNKLLIINTTWNSNDFANAYKSINKYKAKIVCSDIKELKEYLYTQRDFLLKMLENPTLLEHELFSELMMALFHLQEELSNRSDLQNIFEKDKEHLETDIFRVYIMLLKEWVLYMQHLKTEYPYLFSFAIRTNPFDQNAKVELT